MRVFPFVRNRREDAAAAKNRLGGSVGAWVVMTVLSLLLVGAGAIAYVGWTSSDADVPASGYVAMALGTIFSLLVGVGLMALVFYSSRKGYDEPVLLIRDSDEADKLKAHTE